MGTAKAVAVASGTATAATHGHIGDGAGAITGSRNETTLLSAV